MATHPVVHAHMTCIHKEEKGIENVSYIVNKKYNEKNNTSAIF